AGVRRGRHFRQQVLEIELAGAALWLLFGCHHTPSFSPYEVKRISDERGLSSPTGRQTTPILYQTGPTATRRQRTCPARCSGARSTRNGAALPRWSCPR